MGTILNLKPKNDEQLHIAVVESDTVLVSVFKNLKELIIISFTNLSTFLFLSHHELAVYLLCFLLLKP